MTKEQFKSIFYKALGVAAGAAVPQANGKVPHAFMIDLQAFGYSGGLLTCEQAIDRIFISEDKFYRIIDVAITGVHPEYAVAFVRVSGHPPNAYADTLSPETMGPFNILTSMKIEKCE